MSDVISDRVGGLGRAREDRLREESRRLPIGFGLAIGAAVSGGLWAGIIWAIARAF
jgi:hypothetical protein